ncbi:hypothetical protein DX902_09405 [Paenibacillus jamilae]|uniref:hypothetical protein n=1 Tax=Paenibacillus TaxID=44249 RepID=UPI000E3E2F74|nr:hypothetical protein [Paenibacillus jamilae]RFT97718.1 hypothetical protein DX902_09405 [Paenibacillus jamilae]
MDSWLTNALLPYFGLQTLENHWDVMEISEEAFICLNGNFIRKCIFMGQHSYREADVEILTQQREFVSPKTTRDKEKAQLYECFQRQS